MLKNTTKKRCPKVHYAWSKKARAKKNKLVSRYKMLKGCKFCGYKKNPSALEFDHINPKTKIGEVSKMVHANFSVKKLKEEIRKCRVLCSNCHKIKTSEQQFDFNYRTKIEDDIKKGWNKNVLEKPFSGFKVKFNCKIEKIR